MMIVIFNNDDVSTCHSGIIRKKCDLEHWKFSPRLIWIETRIFNFDYHYLLVLSTFKTYFKRSIIKKQHL